MVVFVPCLNEEAGVERAVRSILEVVPTLPLEVRIELIDDGSTDATPAVMDRLAEAHGCSVHRNPSNRGVGRSMLEAYNRADPDEWVTALPGDNEVVFESIIDFVAARQEYDVILGYFRNPLIRPLSRRIASTAFVKTSQMLYGFTFRYLNGMKLVRARAFQGLEVVSSGHAFNAELLAKAMLREPTLRIGECPFVARGRSAGHSKAIRPGAVAQAVFEAYRGYQSIQVFRERVIRELGE